MMYESSFAILDGTNIIFRDERPSIAQHYIENVTVSCDANQAVITGTQPTSGAVLSRAFLEDMSEDDLPVKSIMKPRTLWDMLTGKKRPCVESGYYRKRKTLPYKAIMNHYRLVLQPSKAI